MKTTTLRHKGQTYDVWLETNKQGYIIISCNLLTHTFKRWYLYYTEAKALAIFVRDAKAEIDKTTRQGNVTTATLTINNISQ